MLGTQICKEFTFHAAHFLPHHEGQCRRMHGHSYKLEVRVVGVVNEATGDSDEGMLFDFEILKQIYKQRIEPYVEHENLNETLKGKLPGTWIVARNLDTPLTTCENLARWIADEFHHQLVTHFGEEKFAEKHIGLSIRLWETPTSWAEAAVIT